MYIIYYILILDYGCPSVRPSVTKRSHVVVLASVMARKTKSKGLKGLQQEVGARRAPRLLVLYIDNGRLIQEFYKQDNHRLYFSK